MSATSYSHYNHKGLVGCALHSEPKMSRGTSILNRTYFAMQDLWAGQRKIISWLNKPGDLQSHWFIHRTNARFTLYWDHAKLNRFILYNLYAGTFKVIESHVPSWDEVGKASFLLEPKSMREWLRYSLCKRMIMSSVPIYPSSFPSNGEVKHRSRP